MLKSFLLFLKDFFFPPLCFTCDNLKKNEFFCKDCLEIILRARIHPPFCKRCGRNLKRHKCKIKLKYLDEVYAIFNYTDKIKDLIETYKFKRYTKISEFFVPFIIEHIEKFISDFELTIPVPLHPSRERERGFNQIEIILEKTNKMKEINYYKDILIRIKPTKSQAKIEDKEKRKENITGAFKVIKKNFIKNKKILIIDDVFTTGATLEECAKVLKESGASNIYALCLATGA